MKNLIVGAAVAPLHDQSTDTVLNRKTTEFGVDCFPITSSNVLALLKMSNDQRRPSAWDVGSLRTLGSANTKPVLS